MFRGRLNRAERSEDRHCVYIFRRRPTRLRLRFMSLRAGDTPLLNSVLINRDRLKSVRKCNSYYARVENTTNILSRDNESTYTRLIGLSSAPRNIVVHRCRPIVSLVVASHTDDATWS